MPGPAPSLSENSAFAASSLPPDLVRGLSQKHLPGLDGIRAIAVSLVILYHSGLPMPGGTGVLLFFVLSGFLITWLLLEEAAGTGTISLRNFYARRALRILPAFYVYAIVVVGQAMVRHRPVNYPQLTAALLYFNNYFQGILGDPNTGLSHTWSLAVEEQFYFLWPALFLLFWRKPARMARILTGSIVAVWIYRVILVFVFHANQGYLYEAFDTRADSLMIGCLLAVLLHEGFAAQLFSVACSHRWTVLITLSFFVVSTLAESRSGFDYRDLIGFAVNGTLAFFVIAQVLPKRESPGLLNWEPIRYLGRISYPMYLWQQLVVPVVDKALAGAAPAIRIAGGFAAVVAVASLSWFCVEKPILKLKKRFSAIPPTRTVS